MKVAANVGLANAILCCTAELVVALWGKIQYKI